jgi:hypothetical protein
MPSSKRDLPFLLGYLLALAFQGPVWLCGGLLWGAFMAAAAGWHPVNALVGGVGWGLAMWVVVGNLLAVGLAWRRSAELPAPDRAAFRAALEAARRKLRLAVVAESADEVVLGSRWALLRLPLYEVRVEFSAGAATLTAPAMSFGAVRKQLRRALAEAGAGGQQASRGKGHA